ncbi:MAG: hypothetical protein LLG37_05945 [Spirochaetia bacterium]|nr:hypothetical protein [Spirochaetia bacterium]
MHSVLTDNIDPELNELPQILLKTPVRKAQPEQARPMRGIYLKRRM